MMKINISKIVSLVCIFLFLTLPFCIKAQKNNTNYINPKGNLYFGIEAGSNSIISTNRDQFKSSLQGGLSLEYYFLKQWSAKFRVKLYHTGVSYFQIGHTNDIFNVKDYDYTYNGTVISIPLDVAWNFRIYKNFHGNIFLGPTYNIEISSDYLGLESVGKEPSDFDKNYFNLNLGIGLSYYYSTQMGIYFNYELFDLGGKKGYNLASGLFSSPSYVSPANHQLNVGVKYHFD